MLRRWLCRLALPLLLLASSPARADDLAQAKSHFAIGTRAYEAKQFRVAIDAFEEAHRLAPRPAILFSIGQAYRRQYYIDRKPRDLAVAVSHYKRYISEDPQGARIGEAGAALADLEPLVERLGVDVGTAAEPQDKRAQPARILIAPSVKDARAVVDGGAPIALPARVEVTPGKHTVLITADGYNDERREIELGAGEPFALDIKMTQRPAQLFVEAGSGVNVYVDGRHSGTTPLVQPVNVGAGRHLLSITERGSNPITSEIELVPGENRVLKPDFEPSGLRLASYGFLAAGAAGIASGGVLLGLALYEEDVAVGIRETAAGSNISEQDRQRYGQAIERREEYRAASVATLAGGGALAITGLLLFFLDDPSPEAAASSPLPPARAPVEDEPPVVDVVLAPSVGPDGAFFSVSGRF